MEVGARLLWMLPLMTTTWSDVDVYAGHLAARGHYVDFGPVGWKRLDDPSSPSPIAIVQFCSAEAWTITCHVNEHSLSEGDWVRIVTEEVDETAKVVAVEATIVRCALRRRDPFPIYDCGAGTMTKLMRSGGVITVPKLLSDAEVAELKRQFKERRYGVAVLEQNPGIVQAPRPRRFPRGESEVCNESKRQKRRRLEAETARFEASKEREGRLTTAEQRGEDPNVIYAGVEGMLRYRAEAVARIEVARKLHD